MPLMCGNCHKIGFLNGKAFGILYRLERDLEGNLKTPPKVEAYEYLDMGFGCCVKANLDAQGHSPGFVKNSFSPSNCILCNTCFGKLPEQEQLHGKAKEAVVGRGAAVVYAFEPGSSRLTPWGDTLIWTDGQETDESGFALLTEKAVNRYLSKAVKSIDEVAVSREHSHRKKRKSHSVARP